MSTKGLGTMVLESYLHSFLPHHERLETLFYKGSVAHMVECSFRMREAQGSRFKSLEL